MNDPIRNVTLSFPCREDWDKFEVVPGGRLCGSCKFIVRDFRDCTAAQLRDAMKNGKRVCGRFNAHQLNPAFLKAAAIALTVTTTGCEQSIPAPANIQQDFPVAGQPIRPDSLEFMGDIEIIDDTVATVGIIIPAIEVDSVRSSSK